MAGVNPKAPQESFALRDVLPWIALFVMCLLCVARIAPVWLVVAAAIALALAFDMRALRHVDYALLFTFVAFFVFVGNVARIEVVREAVAALDIPCSLVGAVASQIISNVPAAILVSGFTTDWPALLVGGRSNSLGTLIASMASLISYKQLAVAYPELKIYYFRLFTGLTATRCVALLYGGDSLTSSLFPAALCCSCCGCSHRYCSHGCSRSHRWSLLFASLRALPPLGLGSFVLRLFEPLLCGTSCYSRLFSLRHFPHRLLSLFKWASNVVSFRWRKKACVSQLSGVMLSCSRRCRFGS